MKIMRFLALRLLVCFAVGVPSASGGEVVEFSPESLRRAVESRSVTVHLDKLAVEGADAGVAVARNGYLPDVTASWEVGYLGNGYLTDRNFAGGKGISNPHFVDNFGVEAMQTAAPAAASGRA